MSQCRTLTTTSRRIFFRWISFEIMKKNSIVYLVLFSSLLVILSYFSLRFSFFLSFFMLAKWNSIATNTLHNSTASRRWPFLSAQNFLKQAWKFIGLTFYSLSPAGSSACPNQSWVICKERHDGHFICQAIRQKNGDKEAATHERRNRSFTHSRRSVGKYTFKIFIWCSF